jgi:hypothetical protein
MAGMRPFGADASPLATTSDVTRPPRRAAVAAASGLLTLLLLADAAGLLVGPPVGAADNGDGARLYCGAGLVPLTPGQASNWKGGVVLGFATGAPACPDP